MTRHEQQSINRMWGTQENFEKSCLQWAITCLRLNGKKDNPNWKYAERGVRT